QQAEEARPLDRLREQALLLRRDRGDAARHDLAALGDEPLQKLDVLVVDLRRVRSGEGAGLAPPEERAAGRRAAAAHDTGGHSSSPASSSASLPAAGAPRSRRGRSSRSRERPPPS